LKGLGGLPSVESSEAIGVRDLLLGFARYPRSYPVTPSREVLAQRLYRFLRRVDAFDDMSLRLALYPEKHLRDPFPRPRRKGSKFVDAAIELVTHLLVYRGFVREEEVYFGTHFPYGIYRPKLPKPVRVYRVIRRPSLEECMDILRTRLLKFA
jgi:hypothetical protein